MFFEYIFLLLRKNSVLKIFTNINENITKNCFISIGFFDGVHLGHRYLIHQLRKYANESAAEEMLVTLWPHPQCYFGNNVKLITTLDEKIELLRGLNLKNLLILEFNEELAKKTGREFIEDIILDHLEAQAIVIGYNNSFGRRHDNDRDDFIPESIRIIRPDEFLLDEKQKVSSSLIRESLNEGAVEQANELLGYEFFMSGHIEHGYKMGRKIGFPTANLGKLDESKIIPANGVYISEVNVNDSWFPAMLNIGNRPTFNGTARTVEFHLLNFDENIYNKKIKTKVIKKIRDEIKFDSVDDLKKQLYSDREITMKYFNM
jgi:riboflavin kinase/FMN adenylyltransferase